MYTSTFNKYLCVNICTQYVFIYGLYFILEIDSSRSKGLFNMVSLNNELTYSLKLSYVYISLKYFNELEKNSRHSNVYTF